MYNTLQQRLAALYFPDASACYLIGGIGNAEGDAKKLLKSLESAPEQVRFISMLTFQTSCFRFIYIYLFYSILQYSPQICSRFELSGKGGGVGRRVNPQFPCSVHGDPQPPNTLVPAGLLTPQFIFHNSNPKYVHI